MKPLRKKLILSVLSLLSLFSFPSWSQTGLTGTWKYSDPGGEMILQIDDQYLLLNGQQFQYNAIDNILYVIEGNITTPYPYSLNGDMLNLEFPGGILLRFTRTGTRDVLKERTPGSPKAPPGPADNSDTGNSLLGKWIFQNQQGQLVLEFLSSTQLSFNGEITQYRLQDGIIQAMGDYGYIDYPYSLSSGVLNITFPEGYMIPFSRASGYSQGNNSRSQDDKPVAGDSNWQLQGALCSWSGSSNDYSSYSRTQKIAFDGKGNFSYGSEASFSSDAGLAYSGDPGAERGTYRVGENSVILYFQSGEVYTVQIHMRQNNGMITELMYEGTLYATGLCE